VKTRRGLPPARHGRHAAAALVIAALALGLNSLRADEWAPNLTLSTSWQDNVTNTNRSGDRIGALQTQAEALASQRYELNRDDSARVGFQASAEWWPRFNALNTGALGLRAEWRHTFGPGALAPVMAVALAGDYLAAGETGRRGTTTLVGVSLRKRFDNHWRATLTQEFSNHNARDAVYDRNRGETTLELGYDYSEFVRFTVTGFWRSGALVSYATLARPELTVSSANQLTVDTFGERRIAYSVDARTFGGKVGAIRALDESSALLLGYEYRYNEASRLRCVNQVASLALVHQF
jgi:hypothetical protein